MITVLQSLSEWIIILPFIVGLLLFYTFKPSSKIIFFIVVIALFPQLASYFMKGNRSELNILYNSYTPAEFFLFLFFFATRQGWNKVLITVTVIVAGFTLYFFTKNGISDSVIYELICINNLCYVFLIFNYFYIRFKNEEFLFSLSDAYHTYLLALLLYATCTFFVFADYTATSSNLHNGRSALWMIHNIFNIILYLSFTAGFIIEKKQMQKSSV